jgi:catechol 2,3-dioxygenase-like lactoylglutathione lyase family enzyme
MEDSDGVVPAHVGLTVSDMERSLRFYCEVAGFALVTRREMREAWVGELLHAPGIDLDMALLRLGGLTLQLVQHRESAPDPLALRHNRAGSPHLSIYVRDFEGQYERVRAAGVPLGSAVVTLPGSGRRTFYALDPDGVPVEFMEAPR